MIRNPDALSGEKFDVAVIGGGINGAATAREAALRGLRVALIEAGDFAGGTSSRSSKLIHGGLRYLAQGEFKLVREARLERRRLTSMAPHLVTALPFLLPIYKGDPYSPLKMRVGLSLYDWLGNLGPKDRHVFCSPAEAVRRAPRLREGGLRAGAVYHDSLTDDARLTLENVLDAAAHGAVAVNYAKIRNFTVSAAGEAASAEALDILTGRSHQIEARFWINAAGPWVDQVRALLPGFDGSKTVRLTKGTHVILPCISEETALFAAILPGERIFLMMPWRGCSLLGTTDTEYQGDPAAVRPEASEIEYLIRALNRILRDPVKPESALAAYAGLRALAVEQGKNPSANTREYRFHRDPPAKNLITICGGKLTTARALAEKLVDVIASELPSPPAGAASSPSHRAPFPGGHITGSFQEFVQSARDEAAETFGIDPSIAERLVRTYGSRWRAVLEPVREQPGLAAPLPGAELLEAEVLFSIREEMATSVDDFLLRRSGLSWLAAARPGAGQATADIFARELSWSADQRQAALDRYENAINPGAKVMAQNAS